VCTGERQAHVRAVDGDAHGGEFRHEKRDVIVLVLHDLRGEGLPHINFIIIFLFSCCKLFCYSLAANSSFNL